ARSRDPASRAPARGLGSSRGVTALRALPGLPFRARGRFQLEWAVGKTLSEPEKPGPEPAGILHGGDLHPVGSLPTEVGSRTTALGCGLGRTGRAQTSFGRRRVEFPSEGKA